jgi:carbonic anhydrase
MTGNEKKIVIAGNKISRKRKLRMPGVPNRAALRSTRLKSSSPDAGPRSPEEILQRLKEGNQRFVSGKSRHHLVTAKLLGQLRGHQRPFAVILGCSDSRVPPELIFDQSLGALFVIRLAGNIIAPGVFGSIQYAHWHLGAKVLVVLGHEGCGAVQATLSSMRRQTKHPERIQQIVELIEPGLQHIADNLSAFNQLRLAVEANVRWSKQQVLLTAEAQRALQKDKTIRIVGAVYELATGKIRWLD